MKVKNALLVLERMSSEFPTNSKNGRTLKARVDKVCVCAVLVRAMMEVCVAADVSVPCFQLRDEDSREDIKVRRS